MVSDELVQRRRTERGAQTADIRLTLSALPFCQGLTEDMELFRKLFLCQIVSSAQAGNIHTNHIFHIPLILIIRQEKKCQSCVLTWLAIKDNINGKRFCYSASGVIMLVPT